MRQVRGGCTATLATLFERHHARVYGYCLRMTGNRAAAEDLVQDVFMKMLEYKATFKDDSELVPWMSGIARNACLGYLRRRANDSLAAAAAPADIAEPETEEPHDDEQSKLVRRVLLRLPVGRREVLVLSRYEYKSYDEIARLLDATNGDVIATFVTIDATKPMAFTSFNGDTDVTLPANLAADLVVPSQQGDFYADFDVVAEDDPPSIERDADTRGGTRMRMRRQTRYAIAAGGPDIQLRTFNGDIMIRER